MANNDVSATIPTYQTLFGSEAYYTVAPSRSILSPAAYFVDLMNLVQQNIPPGGSDSHSLQSRRPGLWDITLD